MMSVDERLVRAFPKALTGEAGGAATFMCAMGVTLSPGSFEVAVDGERVVIPERLYLEKTFSSSSVGGLSECLLTRHHDGFVRQRALDKVVRLDEPWAVPFIIRLVGEYVVEIIEQIDQAFDGMSHHDIGRFVSSNSNFVQLTRARVTSYWDCYFRRTPRAQHVGFRLMDRIEATAALYVR